MCHFTLCFNFKVIKRWVNLLRNLSFIFLYIANFIPQKRRKSKRQHGVIFLAKFVLLITACKRSCGKVMGGGHVWCNVFTPVCDSVHGGGTVWRGGSAWQGGHAWWKGACVANGEHVWCNVFTLVCDSVHGGDCVAGGSAWQEGHAWWKVACVANGGWRGHVWWRGSMCGRGQGDMHGREGGVLAGQMATEAGSTHPTGMHSCCLLKFLCKENHIMRFNNIPF